MKKICFLLIIVFVFFGCDLKAPKNDNGDTVRFNSFCEVPGITEEEIKAIETFQNQNASFVYGTMHSTEVYYNTEGELSGFTVHLCEWLSELFGLSFKPKLYEWDELVAGLASGDIDFTGELTANERRRQTYIMTDAIANRFVSYFKLAGRPPLADIAQTRPLKLAFLPGTTTFDDVFKQRGGYFSFSFVSNYTEAYNMLISGEVDAFIDEHNAEEAFADYGNIVVEPLFPLLYGPVSLTTQKQTNAPIISVVQKILENGGIRYLVEMYNTGEYEYVKHKLQRQFTEEERTYIQNNPIVNFVAEHDNYPVSFYNVYDKEFQGIVFDVIKEIEVLTGLKFKLVNDQYDDWAVIFKMLEDGEASIISELIRSPEREGRFLWPKNFISIDYPAFLSKDEHKNIKINEVMYEKVGLVEGNAQTELFNTWFPDHSYTVMYDSFNQAFAALERDEIDMVLGSKIMLLVMANYYELPGYKANLVLDYPYSSTFGFNKNEKVLCSIVDKSLQLINTTEIENQWTGKTFDYRSKITRAQRPWLVGAIGLSFCVLALIFYLYYRSKRFSIIQEQSEYKSIFLANMSHEIRTPMNAITGMSEMLLRGNLPDEMRCYAQDIKHAGNNLISIINDILDISKIEAGKLEIVPVNYMLSSLVNDTVNIIRARLTEKHVWFETAVDENIPNNLIGDEVRMRQIVLNLLSNAVKYTDKGGINFSIETEKTEDDKVWLKITVTDTGKGIKPEDQEKLFNNFIQVDKRKNVGIEGTGLGLAITKRLVDAMGGSISLQSEYGKGSVFTVIIPQGVASPEPFGTLEVAETDYIENTLTIKYTFPNSRILVVDDLPVNLKVVEGLLSPYKAVVDICSSGAEAVELVKYKKFDIIFMDHMMPEMDGIEATKRIRETGYNLPIVALTANAVVGMKEKFIENGFNDFLAKPIDIIKLDEILNRWIDQNKSEQITESGEQRAESREQVTYTSQTLTDNREQAVKKNVAKKIKLLSTKNKFVLFSCILFVIISAIAFITYSISARQINRSHIEQQLAIASETIRLRLATTVNSELSLVLKMADTPVIKQHLLNPDNSELKSLALEEIALYEQHFKSKQAFWVSDVDKLFYSTGNEPYILDPDDPESYWYNMTLYETELFNFNINYNVHMQQINLWVNVPVFVDKKPVGMLGTGIDLTEFSEFVSSGYRDFEQKITPFIFNKFDEITSSLDYDLIFNKVRIDDHLGKAGAELIKAAHKLGDDESISFIYGSNLYQISSISSLEWFLTAIHPLPGFLSLNDAMNMVFFGMLLLILFMFLTINIFISRSQNAIAEQNIQLIEANRKAEAASQAKSDFLGKISHEIRTPINAITGINELILRSNIPDEIRDYAQDIKQAGASLTSIINDILNFSETDVNKLDKILIRRDINTQNMQTVPISIKGVDTAKGIAMTGRTPEKYKQVLSVFCDNAKERLPLLQTVPETDTLPIFITQVHALKSALATIGAQDLSAQAAALEEAGNNKDFSVIKEKLPEFTKDLSDLIKNIGEEFEK